MNNTYIPLTDLNLKECFPLKLQLKASFILVSEYIDLSRILVVFDLGSLGQWIAQKVHSTEHLYKTRHL